MDSQNFPLVIYGAYGYSGGLITEKLVGNGIKPLLAGRNEEKLKTIAHRFNLPYLVFDVHEKEKIFSCLKGRKVLLHCAGPFAHTYLEMINACLETHCHYLDITGEIEVFEGAAKRGEEAKKSGIMLMPGTGFDVVPSDCLALFMKQQLPDALNLKIAFYSRGKMSRGTAFTMIENLGRGGAERKNGKIIQVPVARSVKEFPFENKNRFAASIPWGDVSTAYYSTGIPNLETFIAVPPSQIKLMKLGNYLGWFLGSQPIQKFLKSRIEKKEPGPGENERKSLTSIFYAEAENVNGIKIKAGLKTPEGYSLTAATAALIAEKVLNGNFKPGFMTPSMAYGANLILEITGTERYLL